ncbi:hypothetical protein CSUB01_03410 [Colletotrichum sublineola]|uniref:Uncharacterized protein n=1 Tax=Colletotrichum sublineola TaxID=1173701 RepID=A0A066XHV3_COLSU|nr:hypothetical protein CSUB01_03410 [Colletotrichum sublineola]
MAGEPLRQTKLLQLPTSTTWKLCSANTVPSTANVATENDDLGLFAYDVGNGHADSASPSAAPGFPAPPTSTSSLAAASFVR